MPGLQIRARGGLLRARRIPSHPTSAAPAARGMRARWADAWGWERCSPAHVRYLGHGGESSGGEAFGEGLGVQ